jgi:hypothetical protein
MELEQFLKVLVSEFDRWTVLEPTSSHHRAMTATEFHNYRVGAQEAIGIIAYRAFMTAMPHCSMDDFKKSWEAVKHDVPLTALFPVHAE